MKLFLAAVLQCINRFWEQIKGNLSYKTNKSIWQLKACNRIDTNDVYNINKDWKIINLRYFNPVSVHDSGNIGEVKKNATFSDFEKVVSGQMEKLFIYGDDCLLLTAHVRDYIHIMDLSQAIMRF